MAKNVASHWTNRLIAGIPAGISIRKQFGKEFIFRVRRGNGFFGSDPDTRYQDKYKYFVPLSINNVEGGASRLALAQAVLNWQTVLTQEEKNEWIRRGRQHHNLPGYNLYIREYILANT